MLRPQGVGNRREIVKKEGQEEDKGKKEKKEREQ